MRFTCATISLRMRMEAKEDGEHTSVLRTDWLPEMNTGADQRDAIARDHGRFVPVIVFDMFSGGISVRPGIAGGLRGCALQAILQGFQLKVPINRVKLSDGESRHFT